MIHRLAWYQLLHERRRLLAALAGIAFAVLLQLMQFGFRDALFASATTFHRQIRADLVMISSQYDYVLQIGSVARRRLYQALAFDEVESVVPVRMGVAPFRNTETHQRKRIFVIAFDPEQLVLDNPSVIENAHLLKVPDVVLFDRRSRPEFGPVIEALQQQGSVVTEVGSRQVTIAGLFDFGVSFAGNGHLLMSDATFRRVFNQEEGTLEVGLVRLDPGVDATAFQARLAASLPDDVQVLTREQFAALERTFWNRNSPIGFIFLLGSLVGLIVGAVIVYQILYTDVTDHLAEYATLKAMGYADRYLYAVVLEEAIILALAGFPIGYGLAEAVYAAAREATRLPVEMTVSRATLVFTLTLGMCCLSALLAMRKLRTADPAEVF